MSTTHAEKGGVRSTARLSRPDSKAIYTPLFYTGETDPDDIKWWVAEANQAFRVEAVDDRASTDEGKLSKGDAEVSVVGELSDNRFRNYLLEMRDGETATLEFHGNVGPCNGCKGRIDTASRLLANGMYKGTRLKVFIYYVKPAYKVIRGKNVETTYGYEDCKIQVTYNNYLLYRKEIGPFKGLAPRPGSKLHAAASSTASSSSSSSSSKKDPNANSFIGLEIESDSD